MLTDLSTFNLTRLAHLKKGDQSLRQHQRSNGVHCQRLGHLLGSHHRVASGLGGISGVVDQAAEALIANLMKTILVQYRQNSSSLKNLTAYE